MRTARALLTKYVSHVRKVQGVFVAVGVSVAVGVKVGVAVSVAVEVGLLVAVGVEVGVPWRTMRGASHKASSLPFESLAEMVKRKRTFFPASELKSISTG